MAADSHFQYDREKHQATDGGPDRKRVWINFKPDIDLGHIIAAVSFLIALFTYAQSFDRRMVILEQKQQVQTEITAETKADIKEIKKAVNDIGTNLAVQNAIAARKP